MTRSRWLRTALAGFGRSVPFLLAELGASLASMAMLYPLLFLIPLSMVGVGWLIVPYAARGLRWWAGLARRRTAQYTGVPLPDGYPPLEGPLLDQLRTVIRSRTTWRDLLWLVVTAVPGTLLGMFVTLGLPLGALNALVIPAYWWALPADEPASVFYPVTSWPRAFGSIPIAAALGLITLVLLPRFAALRAWWNRSLLSAEDKATLAERVTVLTASRAAALEAHGVELRRIERNLHDGTQNRLVGVIMHLGMVERALQRDPEHALQLVLKAQAVAEDALVELRDVVRGIYPPILTERGLDGAVNALAVRCPVPCTVVVDGLTRAPAAVESTAYFVVAEALTNVAKHSGAEHAEVRLASEAEEAMLILEITDDGRGGADEAGGTGLTGMRRRVEAFDGRLTVSSPPGGPTVLTAELPCGS
jgi:signal transduction histidine kinase